jgi:transcriptional regulator GlxA family with amidase domain
MNPPIKHIGMLLFDGCDLLDFSGPVAVFHSAAMHLISSGKADAMVYDTDLFSIDGGPIRTLQGVVVETRAVSSGDAAELDTLIVVGGFIDHRSCDPRIIDWIRDNHERIRRVGSVCCGAFMLAASGALDGRPATTHWAECGRLKESFPNLDVKPDSIFVHDDKFWTAAGITSGIDMALAMIDEDHGHALSLLVARTLVVFLKRPGGQSQFSAPLQSQCTDGPIGRLLQWILEHPDADLRTEALADRAAMSLRNFYRAFEGATGTSPGEWIEMARIEVAKRRLEQSADKVEQVAITAGFKSYEQMRKAFARRLGVNPSEFRSRFGSARGGGAERAKQPSFPGSPIG